MKMQDMKISDMNYAGHENAWHKKTDQVVRHENAGHENAIATYFSFIVIINIIFITPKQQYTRNTK